MCTKYPRFSYALSHVVLCLEASCAIIFTVANPFWQSPVVFGIVSKNSHICEITGDTWRKWLGSSNQNVFLKFVWLIFLKWEINCIVQNTKQATPPCHGSIMCVGLKREITFEFLTLGIASACCSAVKPTLLKRRQDSTLFIQKSKWRGLISLYAPESCSLAQSPFLLILGTGFKELWSFSYI